MRNCRLILIFFVSLFFWPSLVNATCRTTSDIVDCSPVVWTYCTPDTTPEQLRTALDATGYSLGAGTGCADFGNGLQCYCCTCNDSCGNAVVEQPQANNNNNNNNNGNNNNGITPIPPPPAYNVDNYFQTKGGSVMSLTGGVVSYLPTGAVFSKDGDGSTSPGIAIGNGASNFGSGTVSSTGWVAGSDLDTTGVVSQKVSYRYDMERVKERIISSVKPSVLNFENITTPNELFAGVVADDGARYLQKDGNLSIVGDLDLGDNKVIIIVNGNVDISKNININDNFGYFAILATGNINIDPSVGGSIVDPDTIAPNLEGIYFAQKNFNTGTGGKQIRIDGAVMGMESVNLQRSGVSAWPSEYFVFRPDILMNTPKYMLRRNNIWQELAP